MPTRAARRLPQIPLALCAFGVSALGLAALALPSSTAVIEQAFVRTLGEAPGLPVAQVADEVVGGKPRPGDLWLTRADGSTIPSTAAAAIGDRISLALDAGGAIDLEVVAIAELAPPAGGLTASGSERLVLVTAREIGAAQGTPRLVRLIVDADTPLSGAAARPADRAL
jgi:hypothetical protein